MTGNGSGPGVESAGAAEDEQRGGGYVGASIRRHPVAFASLYAPSGRRHWWWYALRCPHCGDGHFGRVRQREALDGVRRAGCGRLVWVKVARTYPAEVTP